MPYDIIKLKEHKSTLLIKQQSLFLKIMALKADDAGCDRETLVREIYTAVADQEDDLTNDQKLLNERFVSYYAKLPERTVDKVKEEVKMTLWHLQSRSTSVMKANSLKGVALKNE